MLWIIYIYIFKDFCWQYALYMLNNQMNTMKSGTKRMTIIVLMMMTSDYFDDDNGCDDYYCDHYHHILLWSFSIYL